jgi:hypothetical protein
LTESASGNDRLTAGIAAVAHLQSAAMEVIAALRATLDLAEDVLRDPGLVAAGAAAGDTVSGLLTRLFEAVEPIINPPRPPRPGGGNGPGSDDGPVEHIRVL